MPKLDIAHLHEQGQDMIIVPLDASFDRKSKAQQNDAIDEIQLAARSAGLAGTVVPVWSTSSGMRFIAPNSWHPFFRSINMQFVLGNINRTLSW